MSLHPSVAQTRHGVKSALSDFDPGMSVLVACSGGADSLALLSAAVFEGHKIGLRILGVTIDHGLQDDSDAHARRVVEQMAQLGSDETVTARIQVEDNAHLGPEAAAREGRYAALGHVASELGASAVLLGHTRDDQAETVLLGLTRGSGGRSIAGMRRAYVEDGIWFLRPLIDVSRIDTETACQVEGITFWTDPHNSDPAYTRSRLRQRVMPVIEDELGPGVAAALARTADGLREDSEFLDELAAQSLTDDIPELAKLPAAIRHRVLRRTALAAGAPASELTRRHVLAMDALITDWRGQRWIDLPGHVRARREGDQFQVIAAPRTSD